MTLKICCPLIVLAAFCRTVFAVDTLWNFSGAGDPLGAASGSGKLEYYDPEESGWGPEQTQFGKVSTLGLPALTGGDADVMAFPAASQVQGYRLTHGAPANGPYGETDGLVSNYTVIMDVLFPAASNGKWRALWQTDAGNSSDADFFVQNQNGGGIGISSNYRGSIRPDTWHRVVFTLRAAPGEGQAQRYIDGQFAGAIGTTGSGLDVRWALGPEALLFTDEDGETAAGYVSSLRFLDRAMPPEEIAALGGPHAAGAATPGAAPPEFPKLPRYVGAIGHRGGSFGAAPDNTLAALRKAIADGAAGVEVDTRLTADGISVCVHDETVERTTNGQGNVAEMTLAELKALDAGSWYDPAFAAERIPTLEEVLAEAKGKIFIYLDMKVFGQAQAIKAAVDATGFPVDQLWCWTPDDAGEAQAIRSVVPGVRILWGGPGDDWTTNPQYFSDLRELGVIGFSFGAGDGAADAAFTLRAKQEGFIVEIFTVLDPDAMKRAAAAGVDYMETDFPEVLNAMNPPRLEAASLPFPASGAENQARNLTLTWVGALGTKQHLPHFGTVNPPPALTAQTADLLQRTDLLPGTTYYWSVDAIKDGEIVTPGPVWSFTTAGAAPETPAVLRGLWLFDDAQNPLKAAAGSDLVLSGEPVEWTQTATDDYNTAQAGVITTAGGPGNHLVCAHGITPNGGGAFVNRYTLLLDLYSPPDSRGSWRSLFQTAPANNNDGDYFIRNTDEALGVGDLNYSAEPVDPGQWIRLVLTANLNANPADASFLVYLNGAPFHTHNTANLAVDGRFSLAPAVLLFGDEDGENAPLQTGMAAIWEGVLTEAQVAALGPPGTPVQPPVALPPLSAARDGNALKLTWPATPGVGLERSTTLKAGEWTPLNATVGAGEHTETFTPPSAFFRLRPF